MSLINDALRQASQAHREQAAPPVLEPYDGAKEPPLEALPPLPVSPWSSLLPVVLVAGVVVGVLGVGGWLAWKSWNGKRPQIVAQARTLIKEAPSPVKAGAAPRRGATASAPKAAPPAVVAPPPLAAPVTARPPASPVVATPPPAAAVPHQAQPVTWPALKLQGIFFNPPKSSVVINNKMLFADDEIQGVKVSEIGRHTVVLVMGGQTNTLLLR